MKIKHLLFLLLAYAISWSSYGQQNDLATYTPAWLKDGIVDSGSSHEPWMFLIRRNRADFNFWKKEAYERRLSEDYIKKLAEKGVTLYHLFAYKGYGFEAEKDHLKKAVKAAEIAHKYGMKVNTYVQWNTMVYETFFNEVPEAKTNKWYQIEVSGKPIMLHYGYQQSFRYRPCFNHEGYRRYFKEKILAFVVDSIKSDFIHFDNFVMAHPAEADHNPATITAFRNYLNHKFDSREKRIDRFGIDDLSQVLPPMWNRANRAEDIIEINDPVVQEWIGFRCWSQGEHLAEFARFVRKKNKDIAIEVNPHGLTGYNIIWELAVNHPELAKYTNAFVTEEPNYVSYDSNICKGKFRTYKMGRTTGNHIFTNHKSGNDFAECLALNRSLGAYNLHMEDKTSQKYLQFWNENKDLYFNCSGAEKVAILRSYPSMAFNNLFTQHATNMAEQTLQQNQIPFDIIFDGQLDNLNKYDVLILANQESLSDVVIDKVKEFVAGGGGLVITGNTGKYNEWRRLRMNNGFTGLFDTDFAEYIENGTSCAVSYKKGKAIYIPKLQMPDSKLVNSIQNAELGFATKWKMPLNDDVLVSSVYWCANSELPLHVRAPEWIGISHDSQGKNEIIHLFSYNVGNPTAGITLSIKGNIKNIKAYSPDSGGHIELPFSKSGERSLVHVPNLDTYLVLRIEK